MRLKQRRCQQENDGGVGGSQGSGKVQKEWKGSGRKGKGLDSYGHLATLQFLFPLLLGTLCLHCQMSCEPIMCGVGCIEYIIQ